MATIQIPRFTVDVDRYREAAGISRSALSYRSGIARTTLSRKLENPGQFTLDELKTITAILDIPAEAFQ